MSDQREAYNRLMRQLMFYHLQNRQQQEWQRRHDMLQALRRINPQRFAMLQQRRRTPVKRTKKS